MVEVEDGDEDDDGDEDGDVEDEPEGLEYSLLPLLFKFLKGVARLAWRTTQTL